MLAKFDHRQNISLVVKTSQQVNEIEIVTENEVSAEATTGDVPVKKVVLKNFTKFSGKHLCQCLFFNDAFFTEQLRATAISYHVAPRKSSGFLLCFVNSILNYELSATPHIIYLTKIE